MPRVFDDLACTDTSPQLYREDTFAFLNRVSGLLWDRIRGELELWYEAFPDETGDVRARFRSRLPSQHFAAWWELYLHRLFSRLGFEIEVHPTVKGSTGRPDFTITRDGESLYVEAVMVESGIQEPGRHPLREAYVLDAINQIKAPAFLLSVQFKSVGVQSAPLRRLTDPIVAWLHRLAENIDDLYEASNSGAEPQATEVAAGDWRLALRVIPLAPDQRNLPYHRLIGIGPITTGRTDDEERLGKALRRKRKRYGAPDRPLLVAALAVSGTMDDQSVAAALYGAGTLSINLDTRETRYDRTPNGVWVGRRGLIGRRVSGVLMGHSLGMYSIGSVLPRLWHHPAPNHPVTTEFPFPTAHVVDDHLDYRDGTVTASDLLGIRVDWPGPEPPFPR